jgi:hypothetical protein
MSSAYQAPNSPMWEMEPADSLLNTAFYLHKDDSQPDLPPNAQEWQMSPDFYGLEGPTDLPPLPPLEAEPEPDPTTVALIKDAEAKLSTAQDKLSAYQVMIAERRCHKSKADKAKRIKELEKEIGVAQRWLTMVSAY